LLFIQTGNPTQSAFIESFNSRVRPEFHNAHWFRLLLDARNAADRWRHAYHTTHSHSSLGYMTPEEFLGTYENTPTPQKSPAA
jgi:putative transposase